jgi:hypothetical protein
MKWTDVDANGVWSIPRATREKGNAGRIQLPELALAVLARLPRLQTRQRRKAVVVARHVPVASQIADGF